MGNKRKLLAFVLVCTMVFSLMPILPVSAAVPDLPIRASVSNQGSGGTVPGELLVKFKPSVSDTAIEGIHKLVGAQKIGEIKALKVHEVKLPAGLSVSAAVAKYKKMAGVEYAEPNHRVQAFAIPNDTYYSAYQWDLAKISAPQAWDVTTGDQTLVAVVDTGVNYNHEDLAGKVINGYDFAYNDADAYDNNGHGTHVSGTIGALTNNAKGVAGISWGAKILAVKVLDSKGSGYDSWVASGITYAADHGSKVINLSLGGPDYSTTLADAVSYAQGKGCLVVAAAGNDNSSAASYPAGYPNVIGVAATTTDDQKASYSNYGPAVDIAAPGGNSDGVAAHYILSCYNSSNSSYVWMSGTSMASPHVAGLAALILSRYPGKTNSQVARMIQETTDDLGAAGRDSYFGYGRINAQKAVTTNIVNDEEISSGAAYAGSWASASSSYASGGTYKYSGTTGNSVTYSFYGTGVTWVANRGTSAGIARVYIDGSYVQDADLYGADDYQQLVYTKSGLALGNHTLKIEVSGNKNASSSGTAITIDAFDVTAPLDTTPPAVTGSDPAMSASNVAVNKTITLTFNENISAGSLYNNVSVTDRNGSVATTKSISGTTLTIDPVGNLAYEGTVTVSVPAGAVADAAGNALASSYTLYFSTQANPDTTPPTVSITVPADSSLTNDNTPLLSYTISDGSVTAVTVDGASVSTRNGQELPVQSDGAHIVTVYAVDTAGNVGSAQSAFTVDATVPTITGSDPAMFAGNMPINKVITLTFSDNVSAGAAFDGIAVLDRSGSVAINKSLSGTTLVITPLSDLAYESTVTVSIPTGAVVDVAGNGNAAYDLYFFTRPMVDTIAPTAGASPVGGLYNSAQSVTLTASEPAAIYYTTDDSTPTVASSRYSGLPLSIGITTTLKFIAVDDAGNQSPVYTEIYTIDSAAPVVEILSPVNGGLTNDSTPQLSYTVDDPTADVVVSVDTIPVSAANDTDLGSLADGTHTVKVTATDAAGNSSSSQSTFTVDTVAPTASATPAGGLYNSAQSVTLTASEPGAIYYTTDGTNPTAASSMYAATPIAITASTTLKFIAVDAAGNVSAVYAGAYTIDTNAPTVTVTDPANGATDVAVANTITLTFSENIQAGSAYDTITVENNRGRLVTINKSISGNVLVLDPTKNLATRTTYTVSVPAGAVKDAAGNALAGSYSFSFTTSRSTR
ncbi:MAG: S8 family serine peptidase [Candidatus Aquicultor sp.]